MHATEREQFILSLLETRGFVSFRELEEKVDGSAATIRRDLERLASNGRLVRVRGGARLPPETEDDGAPREKEFHLQGVPFHENIALNRKQKEAIGAAAARLCRPGEAVMIDGGSTTLQMCPHLQGLNLSVLTNSLHIVSALINQSGTRVLVPSGAVFPEQSIILSVFEDAGMPQFHAPKLFIGAAAIGGGGMMQVDPVLVAAERQLIERADEIILLADASKFDAPSGHIVCPLAEIDMVVTDDRLVDKHAKMIEDEGVRIVIAP
ncbi:DeoR/GlpR family DNA-binding transcription regulator [Sphingopyxis sp. XHP0097]|uniref:DeoR/GlpR family DNA-binding transcription regulator n=1 Tax=Sphingopyxis jiangsuensis TaxID=2871171 RepID=A0ABS7MHJ9_9SPHN|nr:MULTISPECIES: DeoR/GlpR family DNA-binding transcription regulator [Sphingopyxis]MBL0768522.1 DeoR/GlpR transcriptional regulator [Sphingopyxis lutea]MBY4638388.1 DeoR/GlpR family DNA-binding transcription regulator [Sphingopyxis jiangsuensis]